MSHIRQQIRDKVAVLLATTATAGGNVLIGRTRPLPPDHDPALLVYTTPAASGGQESVQALSFDDVRVLERKLMLSVVGHVQEPNPCDDTLDTIAAEVETALANALIAGAFIGLAKDLCLSSTVSQVDAKGDRHEGAIRLVFSITYHTPENAPQTAA